MFRLWSIIVVLLGSALAYGPRVLWATEANAKDSNVIIVGSELDYPPYSYIDSKGRPAGYAKELIEAVAEREGLTVVWRVGAWAEIRKEHEQGLIDVLPFMAKSAERAEQSSFSQPHIAAHDAIFIRKNSVKIERASELAPLKLVLMAGDSAQEYVRDQFPLAQVMLSKTLTEAFQLLSAGKADAMICAQVAGLQVLRIHGIENIEMVRDVVLPYERNFAFAVRKNENLLLSRLNDGLLAVKSNGIYQEIYEKWITRLDPIVEKQKLLQEKILFILAALASGFIIVASWSISLKREVQKRTKDLVETRKLHREVEIQSQQVLNAMSDMVLLKGPQSRILWANRAFCEYYGMSGDELKGIIDAPFSPPDHTLQYVRDDAWVFQHGKPLDVAREPVTNADGSIKYFHTVKSPIFDDQGQVTMTVGILRDITEQDRTQLLLQESEAKLRLALEVGQIGTWYWDPHHNRVDASSGILREVLNLSHPEITLEEFCSTIHPEDAERVRMDLLNCFSDVKRFVAEYRLLLPDQSIRWIYNRAEPVQDRSSGLVEKVAGVVIDVTERKVSEATIVDQQSQLAASARLASLGEMAGGIAHEINNPLTIILGKTRQAKILLERSGQVIPPGVIESLDAVYLTGERIGKIVRGMRNISRGVQNDPFERATLVSIFDETLSLCSARFKDHGVELIREKWSDAIELNCRPTQISQIILNLLSNAFDAIVGQAGAWVRITVEVVGREVEIAIIDNGPGIPPEIQAKILRPFFTTKAAGKGTGLGLSIVKRIIDDHGGNFFLDKNSPYTRFVFVLPLYSQALVEPMAS